VVEDAAATVVDEGIGAANTKPIGTGPHVELGLALDRHLLPVGPNCRSFSEGHTQIIGYGVVFGFSYKWGSRWLLSVLHDCESIQEATCRLPKLDERSGLIGKFGIGSTLNYRARSNVVLACVRNVAPGVAHVLSMAGNSLGQSRPFSDCATVIDVYGHDIRRCNLQENKSVPPSTIAVMNGARQEPVRKASMGEGEETQGERKEKTTTEDEGTG